MSIVSEYQECQPSLLELMSDSNRGLHQRKEPEREEQRGKLDMPSPATGRYVVPNSIEDIFERHLAKLGQLRGQQSLIPQGAQAPSVSVVDDARDILGIIKMNGLLPTRVVASAENGVAICFVRGDDYSDIECLNTGEILAVTSNRHDRPTVWEIGAASTDMVEAVDQIRRFLSRTSAP